MKSSKHKSFRQDILSHLSKYNQEGPGLFRGKYYNHIVNLEGKKRLDTIRKIIEGDGVCPDLFTGPHMYAHHLNSSQVVCYEFFRPYLCSDGRINDSMLEFLDKIEVPSKEDFTSAEAKFEWVPDPEEKTNFDFFINAEGQSKSIYFEIKYTEQGFGKCVCDSKHKEKFDKIYKKMIQDCACLKTPTDIEFSEFSENYQLFRNVLRINKTNEKNAYVVFLFPKENKAAVDHYNAFFEKFINPQFKGQVKCVYWEDLTKYMSERFRNKFFFYTV